MSNEIVMPIEGQHDNRGYILTILKNIPIDSVLHISSKAGAIRANHYHKTSSHYCYLTSGLMYYYERPCGSNTKPICMPIFPFKVFYTGPMVEHCMEFVSDSEMLCFSTGSRDQKDYEQDLVRLGYDLAELYRIQNVSPVRGT